MVIEWLLYNEKIYYDKCVQKIQFQCTLRKMFLLNNHTQLSTFLHVLGILSHNLMLFFLTCPLSFFAFENS